MLNFQRVLKKTSNLSFYVSLQISFGFGKCRPSPRWSDEPGHASPFSNIIAPFLRRCLGIPNISPRHGSAVPTGSGDMISRSEEGCIYQFVVLEVTMLIPFMWVRQRPKSSPMIIFIGGRNINSQSSHLPTLCHLFYRVSMDWF